MKRTFTIAITFLMLVPCIASSQHVVEELTEVWQFEVESDMALWDDRHALAFQKTLMVHGLAPKLAFLLKNSDDDKYRYTIESEGLSGWVNATSSSKYFAAMISTQNDDGETYLFQLDGKRVAPGLLSLPFIRPA